MKDPGTEIIRRNAEAFVHQIKAQFGVDLDFGVSSLASLDAYLSELLDMALVYDAMDDAVVESLAGPIASYVGEVLIRCLAAEWTESLTDSTHLPILRLSTGQQIDLEESVKGVMRGVASPSFHELAIMVDGSRRGKSGES